MGGRSWWAAAAATVGVVGTSGLLAAGAGGAGGVTQVLLRQDGLDDGAPFGSVGGYFGWQENSRENPNNIDLYILDPTGNVTRINAPHTDGIAGGIDGRTVVYSEASGASVHLKLYDLASGLRTDIWRLHTAEADYHPTMSGAWILFTRGDRRRRTEVLMFNRTDGRSRRLASITARGRRAFVYSGQVAGRFAVWGRVTPQGQDVFRYDIVRQTTTRLRRPRGVFARYDPGVTPGGTVYFGQSGSPCRPAVQLVRQPMYGRSTVVGRLPPGVDAGYMYAIVTRAGTGVLYARFTYQGCETGGAMGPGAIYEIVDRP